MYSPDDNSVLQGVTVLVVDDDFDSRELVTVTLQIYGANVVACGSVQEALAVFAGVQPQAIISDIAMPHADGCSLIEAIRSFPSGQGRRIRAIAFSARAREEDQRRALGAGFDRYLTKPLEFEKLIAALVKLLQERNENEGAQVDSADEPQEHSPATPPAS
jgi:CheY-like chemotaxis protein